MIDLFKIENKIVHKPDVPALVPHVTDISRNGANPRGPALRLDDTVVSREGSIADPVA